MKNLISFMIFAFAAMVVAAQNRTTIDILKSYKWEADSFHERGITYFETYTDTTYRSTVIWCGVISENNQTINYQYYLSDTGEYTFDPSKIGTVQSGEYIIAKQADRDNVSCYIIMELNDTMFTYKHIPPPGEIRVGGGPVTLNAKPK